MATKEQAKKKRVAPNNSTSSIQNQSSPNISRAPNSGSHPTVRADSTVSQTSNTSNRAPNSEGSSLSSNRDRNVPSNHSHSHPVTKSVKRQRISTDPMHSPSGRESALTQNVQTPTVETTNPHEDQNLEGSREDHHQIPAFSPIHKTTKPANGTRLGRDAFPDTAIPTMGRTTSRTRGSPTRMPTIPRPFSTFTGVKEALMVQRSPPG